MDTLNVLTLYFAKGIAIYMIVTGLAGLAAPQRWRAMVDDLTASPGLTYISGAFVLILGITLVFLHFFWSDPLAMIVSLVCLLVLVEGVILMVMPEMVLLGIALVFLHFFWSDPLAMIVSLVCLLVLVEGVILMVMPEMVLSVARQAVASNGAVRFCALVSLVAGVLLLIAAMMGRAGIA